MRLKSVFCVDTFAGIDEEWFRGTEEECKEYYESVEELENEYVYFIIV